jgi:hypothetical protein
VVFVATAGSGLCRRTPLSNSGSAVMDLQRCALRVNLGPIGFAGVLVRPPAYNEHRRRRMAENALEKS